MGWIRDLKSMSEVSPKYIQVVRDLLATQCVCEYKPSDSGGAYFDLRFKHIMILEKKDLENKTLMQEHLNKLKDFLEEKLAQVNEALLKEIQ